MRSLGMKTYRLLAAAVLVPALLPAQSPSSIKEFTIDAGHSIVEFAIPFAFNRVKGRFSDTKGTILYNAANPSLSSITVVIASKTIDTGWAHRDEHLKTSDFFDVEKFPTIAFQSDRMVKTQTGWRAEGRLTMHGVTKAISIPFRLLQQPSRDPQSGWLMLNTQGSLRLARADFGIFGGSTYNSWFDKGRAATMGDSVDINLEIEGYSTDAQSQRTPGIVAALERIRAGGIQAQINRIDSIQRAVPNAAAGLVNGGDMVTRALIANGKAQDAVTLSKALAEKFPQEARAHVVYGVALADAGDNRAAAREFDKAKEVFKPIPADPNEKFPQVDETWYYMDQLARTLLEWNKPGIAAAVSRAVADMYPQFARAHTMVGVALAATGDKRGASEEYAHALALDPTETRALEYQRH